MSKRYCRSASIEDDVTVTIPVMSTSRRDSYLVRVERAVRWLWSRGIYPSPAAVGLRLYGRASRSLSGEVTAVRNRVMEELGIPPQRIDKRFPKLPHVIHINVPVLSWHRSGDCMAVRLNRTVEQDRELIDMLTEAASERDPVMVDFHKRGDVRTYAVRCRVGRIDNTSAVEDGSPWLIFYLEEVAARGLSEDDDWGYDDGPELI